jgi:ligand-binding sensor domain-containing protein
MADGEDGALLVSTKGAVTRLADGKSQVAYPYPAGMREVQATQMLRDRDGGLWVGTLSRGIVHIHQGKTDVFSQSDGLTGDTVRSFFEDREGNVWAATENGLDRFRELPVVTYTTEQRLSSNVIGAVLAATDGSVWFDTPDGLNRLKDGQATVYGQDGARIGAGSLFQDSHGRIWVSTATGVGYLERDRFVSTAVPGGSVEAITQDVAGDLWIANQNLGLIKVSPTNEIQQIPWDTLGHKDLTLHLAADPLHGGVWAGFYNGGLAWFREGRVRASYAAAGGLAEGRVNQLRFDREGALWAATVGGLSRLKTAASRH